MDYAIREGNYEKLGVQKKDDAVIFTFEGEKEENCSILFYGKKAEPVCKILVPEEYCRGSVRSVAVTGKLWKNLRYNYEINGKIITDTYATRIIGREKWNDKTRSEKDYFICGGAYPQAFDWENDRQPEIKRQQMVMYKLHVRGFSMEDTSCPRKERGTFRAITDKIPYLKKLGITTIELMPAYEFEEQVIPKKTVLPDYLKWESHGEDLIKPESVQPVEKINYWGYVPGNYFAPKASYSSSADAASEFRELIHTLHENGMECVMEFYFVPGMNQNVILDALRFWVREYHVDGFHVRGVQGICNLMATDPLFADTKLLNIYFPVEEIYGKKNLPKKRMVAECNDGFMIDVRRFLKGDEESLKAFAERMRRNPKGSGLINYIASHDGFTLCDLVSYEERHNEDNGEQNRDGRVQNYSWNCGEEGKSRKKKILELRNRQMKNAWCMLLLSAGTPMILAGDEFCNSQLGNNNPYCLDNEISWLDWKGYKSGNSEMFRFVKDLIAFRKKHKILHMGQELSMTDSLSCGFPGISYHSSSAWYGELDGQNRKIGVMYCGKYADEDELIYIAYNMHWMEHTFALPALPGGYRWNVALDTSEGILEEDKWRLLPDSRQVQVSSRTVIVLIGRKHKDVKESNRTLHNHHKA